MEFDPVSVSNCCFLNPATQKNGSVLCYTLRIFFQCPSGRLSVRRPAVSASFPDSNVRSVVTDFLQTLHEHRY